MRSIRASLPYKSMTKMMVIHLVYYVVICLNEVPPKGGISKTISPRTIISWKGLDSKLNCALPFGSYIQTIEEPLKPNIINKSQTMGSMTLGPGNSQCGGYYFMSLTSGKKFIGVVGRNFQFTWKRSIG